MPSRSTAIENGVSPNPEGQLMVPIVLNFRLGG